MSVLPTHQQAAKEAGKPNSDTRMNYYPSRAVLTVAVAILSLWPQVAHQSSAQTPPAAVWQVVANLPAPPDDPRIMIRPSRFTTFTLDAASLRSVLAAAPMEFTPEAQSGRVEVRLPMPDGQMARFRAEESPIMEAPLAARYPDIKTYRAQGIDDPAATARFSLTPKGVHAIVLSPSGAYYIDPVRRDDAVHHLSYFKADLERTDDHAFGCELLLPDGRDASDLTADSASQLAAQRANGAVLRTYRLAMAANYEYSDFHSDATPLPDKGDVLMNGIIPTVNRVNSIYEREVAVRFVLVENEELIIFNTPADPYENSEGRQMLAANQGVCDGAIGTTNYDIGHVVSTGGGGVAFLGVVCNPAQKAGGVTGLPRPTGDAFYVDYVAHEMGHQFGGAHTFNGNVSNCAGANRTASTAYEPGSGSTIQAYAGICPPQDLQRNSDPYFHTISYDQIVTHITSAGSGGVGGADGCATKTNTGNAPPTVDAGPDRNIPARTPFTLIASGSDPDGDLLSYCWEQFDLGPTNNGQVDNGSSPIFRSYNPTLSPARMFPSLRYVLHSNNTPHNYQCGPRICIPGEVLPTTTRALKFRVTARDNRSGGGGVEYDLMQINVTDTGAPFAVTAPNGAETWEPNATSTVTWNVAGTATTPINTANVDIHLSTDGGETFPIVLATDVPNDGSHDVTVPAVPTAQARVRVTGSGNIFFDVSDANFAIASPLPQATSVVSRKTHGATATFDINLPLTGSPGVECRSGGAGANHTLIFTFADVLTSANATVTRGTATVSSSEIGRDPRELIVELAGVSNAQTVEITVPGGGGTGVSAQMAILLGDTTGDRFTDAGDIGQTKSRSGQALSTSNFRSDVTVDGFLDAGDISTVKSRSGTALPPP